MSDFCCYLTLLEGGKARRWLGGSLLDSTRLEKSAHASGGLALRIRTSLGSPSGRGSGADGGRAPLVRIAPQCLGPRDGEIILQALQARMVDLKKVVRHRRLQVAGWVRGRARMLARDVVRARRRPAKPMVGAKGIASLTSELHWPLPRLLSRGLQLTEFPMSRLPCPSVPTSC
jgi:hypothetical protein